MRKQKVSDFTKKELETMLDMVCRETQKEVNLGNDVSDLYQLRYKLNDFINDYLIEIRCNMIDKSDIINLDESDEINRKLCNGHVLWLRDWNRCPTEEKELLESLIELRKYKVIYD
jgi:hypothetical protein